MKRLFLYIIGAFFAEIMIIILAIMFSLDDMTLIIVVGLLPASLFLGAIVFLVIKYMEGMKTEENKDNESTK